MLDLDPERPPVAPRDAATVLLLREEEPEGFSVFMVRRHAKSGFMAGAYVFPGGTLDAEDRAPGVLAKVTGRSAEEAAAMLGETDGALALGLFVAALRETFEEAGVLLADGVGDADLSEARDRLNAGADFGVLVDELGLTLRVDALAPLSRWVTPTVEKRRYDARFFVARAPTDQEAAHDRVEVTAGEWLRPNDALARWERGEIALPPPTLRTVEQLASFDSVDAVFASAEGEVPRPVQPELLQLEDTMALVLPGDPAHSVSETRIAGPTRFVLIDGRFRSRDP
jgi:8-oxo-dGTP pyrophosphatase MutT (NUDIX family)